MIVSICSKLYDNQGNFLVDADENDSDFSSVSRRVSRSATLDGGCIIVDNGYTPSDATFTIVIKKIDDSKRLGILAMTKIHSLVTVANKDAVYEGVIESIQDINSMKIKFLVKSILSE
jgi:hypothetical protein